MGESEARDIQDAIEAGVPQGWHSFQQNIIQHFEQKRISEENVMLYSVNKTKMRQALDLANKKAGDDDSSSSGSDSTISPYEPPPAKRDV